MQKGYPKMNYLFEEHVTNIISETVSSSTNRSFIGSMLLAAGVCRLLKIVNASRDYSNITAPVVSRRRAVPINVQLAASQEQ